MKRFKFKKLLYLVILLIIIFFLFFNEYGVIRYLKIKGEISDLNSRIENAQKKIDSLHSEIDSLNNNLYKIEKVAREKYHMLGKNEQALKIEKKQVE